MVDIHCHILPGLDDGPDTVEESIGMARAAIADGITHIVATPHANDSFNFDLELNQKRRDELQTHIGKTLTLATGCDFHLSFENLQAIQQAPQRYTINQKNYLLVEFADFAIPPTIDQTLVELVHAGLHPVITHPERNPLLRTNRKRVLDWIVKGCSLQVTGQSLLGRFGPAARDATQAWLDEDAIHFVASDAHNLTSRPPKLQEAFALVSQYKGTEVAQALFFDNPLAALEGRTLPHMPEPAEPGSRRKRKRFMFFSW